MTTVNHMKYACVMTMHHTRELGTMPCDRTY